MLVRVERANQNERQRTVSTHFWWANRQNSLNDFRSFSSVAFLVNRWFSIKINHYGIGNLINLQLKFSLQCTDLKPIFRLSNRRLFLVLKKTSENLQTNALINFYRNASPRFYISRLDTHIIL